MLGIRKGTITKKRNVIMKKEYITPEMIVRKVILDGLMEQSTVDKIDPPGDTGWNDMEAKDDIDNSFSVWED